MCVCLYICENLSKTKRKVYQEKYIYILMICLVSFYCENSLISIVIWEVFTFSTFCYVTTFFQIVVN